MKSTQRPLLRSLLLAAGSASLVATGAALAQQTAPAGGAASEQRQPEQTAQEAPRERANPDGERRGPRYGERREGREGRDAGAEAQAVDPGAAEPPERPAPPQGDLEEWERAMTFMKEHSPKRWALLPELPEYFQQGVRERMFGRYRQLERWRNADKEMYDIGMRRLALEDELWTTRMSIRIKGQTLTSDEVAKLREKVAAFVDLALEERELRIQRLRDILKREETFLAGEKGQRDAMVSENTAMLERGERSSLLGGPGGGGGFGGFGGPGPGGGRVGPGPGGPGAGGGGGGGGGNPPPRSNP
jgi:hypothetical protein